MDYIKGVHRGYAFVEYEEVEDANEAIYNLDGSEMLGRTIRVSLAQANQVKKLLASQMSEGTADELSQTKQPLSSHHEAVWKSDEWFQQHLMQGSTEETANSAEQRKWTEQDQKTLQNL
jgi:RNA recognition motif-containing protein